MGVFYDDGNHIIKPYDSLSELPIGTSLYWQVLFCIEFLSQKVFILMADNGYGSALQRQENNVDARLNLASLFIEDSKEDEAISLLSPKNFGNILMILLLLNIHVEQCITVFFL